MLKITQKHEKSENPWFSSFLWFLWFLIKFRKNARFQNRKGYAKIIKIYENLWIFMFFHFYRIAWLIWFSEIRGLSPTISLKLKARHFLPKINLNLSRFQNRKWYACRLFTAHFKLKSRKGYVKIMKIYDFLCFSVSLGSFSWFHFQDYRG